MSTTIYDGPDEFKKTVPDQGQFSIDITYSTVWFFEHTDKEDDPVVTVPLAQLPAIHKAIGEYLDAVGAALCPDCGGLGYYATGPTDAPVQTQCQRCVGVRTSPSREPE